MRARPPLLVVPFALALALLACSGGGASTKSFCSAASTGDNPLAIFDRYDPAQPAAAQATLQQGVDRLRQLEATAPSGDVRSSVTEIIKVAEKLMAILDQRASNPSSAAPADFSSDFDKLSQASSVVTRFASERCGVQLDPTAPTTQTPNTSPGPPPSSSS